MNKRNNDKRDDTTRTSRDRRATDGRPGDNGAGQAQQALEELAPTQWEALCKRCALCCAHKIQDADTGKVYYLKKKCRLLDPETRLCRHYEERERLMPDCVKLTPENVRQFDWLPATCAYRQLATGTSEN